MCGIPEQPIPVIRNGLFSHTRRNRAESGVICGITLPAGFVRVCASVLRTKENIGAALLRNAERTLTNHCPESTKKPGAGLSESEQTWNETEAHLADVPSVLPVMKEQSLFGKGSPHLSRNDQHYQK